jgi:glycosyltransferase involved in cell wall biosynthesis
VRLLTVSPYFESHRGGVEIVAGRLARELQGRGVEVTWLASNVSAPPAQPPSQPLGVWNVAERRLGIPYPLPSPGALAAIDRQARACDALLVHDALYATSVAAVLAARRHGKPVLMVQHIGQIPYRGWLARALMASANATLARAMLALADQVVFISQIAAGFFAAVRFRRPPLMIFNGVDTDVFRPTGAESRVALKIRLGLAEGRPQALFVGRFVEKKGLRHLARLTTLRTDIDFNFAGWGPLDPQGWGRTNVRVFRDLAGAGLAELYQACDVLVLPSVGEGFPLVVQEALACGLPVICGAEVATADPEAARFLTGVAIDDDPEVTAVRLNAALDASLAGSADDGGARAAFARRRYAWDAVGARYLEALQGLVSRPAALGDERGRAAASPVVTS